MDVYTMDNVYLGTVLRIIVDSTTPARPAPGAAEPGSSVQGELLGPMPTQPIGNPGPTAQSAPARYASTHDTAEPLGAGTILVGKWWGLVERRVISVDLVQTVSMERIVLRLRKAELM